MGLRELADLIAKVLKAQEKSFEERTPDDWDAIFAADKIKIVIEET